MEGKVRTAQTRKVSLKVLHKLQQRTKSSAAARHKHAQLPRCACNSRPRASVGLCFAVPKAETSTETFTAHMHACDW